MKKLRQTQKGAVLLLAMIFLLLLAIVAGTVTQTSILEFLMAGNAQFKEEAFQQANAVVTEIASDIDNFPVVGTIGYSVCPSGCDATFSTTLTSLSAISVSSSYEVRRRGPEIVESLPFRQSEGTASSSPNFDAAIFEIDVTVDGSEQRLGTSRIVQGMAIRVASSGQ